MRLILRVEENVVEFAYRSSKQNKKPEKFNFEGLLVVGGS